MLHSLQGQPHGELHEATDCIFFVPILLPIHGSHLGITCTGIECINVWMDRRTQSYRFFVCAQLARRTKYVCVFYVYAEKQHFPQAKSTCY